MRIRVAISRRIVVGLALVLGLSACSLGKPKRPELPAVTDAAAMRSLWSVPVGRGGVGFAPSLANGQIFAAARDGTVVRIDATSGQIVYRVQLAKPLAAGVGSDGESAVVISRDGDLIALDGKGAVSWTIPMRLDSTTPPAVALGNVIVRSADNRVIALDLSSGKLRWNFQRNAPSLVLRQASGIAVTSSTVVVGMAGGRLLGLGLQDGSPRWEGPVAFARGSTEIDRLSDVVGTPLVIEREVCAVALNGNATCLDANNGQIIWARAASSNSGLDIDARTVVVSRDDGQISAFAKTTGTPIWTQSALKSRALSAPIIAGTAVLVGDDEGFVHAVSRADGVVLSRLATDGSAIVSQPVANANRVILQTSAGGLFAFQVR